MESEFPGTSHIPPRSTTPPTEAEPKKEEITKVISGEAIVRKKPLGKRLMENFSGADSKTTVAWVYNQVIVPSIKKLIFESAQQSLQMKLFGQASPGIGPSSLGQNIAQTSYNRMYATPPMTAPGLAMTDPRQQAQPGSPSYQARQQFDFREILIPSRAEALMILDTLYAALSQYEVVSVADFYKACGITPAFTDERFGWTALTGSDVMHVNGMWMLNLPVPQQIN